MLYVALLGIMYFNCLKMRLLMFNTLLLVISQL
jgi:hypothetical protein